MRERFASDEKFKSLGRVPSEMEDKGRLSAHTADGQQCSGIPLWYLDKIRILRLK